MKKAKILVLLLLCLALVPALSAEAGFCRQANGRYRYYTNKKNYKNGKYVKGAFINIRKGKKVFTYYFDKKSGYMVTGWKKLTVKGVTSRYYFDANGKMFKNRTKNGHYLKGDGRMAVNEMIKGVYYGPDGSAIEGYKGPGKFVKSKKGIKYMQPNGTYAAKAWKCIKDGKKYYWFYFYSNGFMARDKWVGDKYVDKQGHWIVNKKKPAAAS